MNKHTTSLFITIAFLFGCSQSDEKVAFGNMNIPEKYVLNYDLGPEGVFDKSNDIALMLPADEIKAFIPDYVLPNYRNKSVSFIVFPEKGSLEEIETSFLEGFESAEYDGADKYSDYIKRPWYTTSWLLLTNSSPPKFIAICGSINSTDSCNFPSNIRNYYVEYALNEENIALNHELESLIAKKFDEWEVEE